MKEKLLKMFHDLETDVDLIIYYFNSSLERFIEGDFRSSFMDSYKIVFDNEGSPFAKIFVLPNLKEKLKSYSEIRAILVHAKGRGANLQKIMKTQKKLIERNLELLKIVKFEYLEGIIETKRKQD